MLSESELNDVYEILHELKKIENMICDLMDVNDGKKESEVKLSKAISAFSLSAREAEVLRLILEGHSNNDISELINVSVSTVKKHVYNIFNKSGVNSRTQLLNMVYGGV